MEDQMEITDLRAALEEAKRSLVRIKSIPIEMIRNECNDKGIKDITRVLEVDFSDRL